MDASPHPARSDTVDALLVGGGIMSASLAVMLKLLAPSCTIRVIEVGSELAGEASDGWNNAGTGHAGLCELSYTPSRDPDGSVRVDRALAIFGQFEHSRQFWAHAVANGIAGPPAEFIHVVPHVCFVQGRDDVDFLRARHEALRGHHFFSSMRFTTDPDTIAAWAPLVMEGRPAAPVAATRADRGTEIDYGRLARQLLHWLGRQEGGEVVRGCRVSGLRRGTDAWRVEAVDGTTGERIVQRARFVFVGAGGGSLPLLQSTGLRETAGLAGFPIGGQWLVCDVEGVVARHGAKVYGATPPASPSLGAPHLDLRRLDGHERLLFGPFASWTTRFLRRSGRWTDLPRSLRPGNAGTLLRTAVHNPSLLRYLVGQSLQTMHSRMEALRCFFPLARQADWRLVEAGIRVQTLKRSDRGEISFGTEVFASPDRSLAALLGASPGASVAVSIALETIRTCLPHVLATPDGRSRMKRIIPVYDVDLSGAGGADCYERYAREADETLGLVPAEPV